MIKIQKLSHPESLAVTRAWEDNAIVTGRRYMIRPYWYQHLETGQLYHDLYGCIGWPSEVSDKDDGMPGYIAVVGVVKTRSETKDPKDAAFQLLAEFEHKDVPTLLEQILVLRKEYGFGLTPELLHSWLGDPDRFVTILALLNETLTINRGSTDAILVSPPDDFYIPKAFDHYVRSFRSVIMPDRVRFYFGKHDILKNRLKEFRQNDPAVYSVGGLIHTLLSGCTWMAQVKENAFMIKGEEDLGYE